MDDVRGSNVVMRPGRLNHRPAPTMTATAKFAVSALPEQEVTLVQQTLAEVFVEEPVQRLIGDYAYDSDRLDR